MSGRSSYLDQIIYKETRSNYKGELTIESWELEGWVNNSLEGFRMKNSKWHLKNSVKIIMLGVSSPVDIPQLQRCTVSSMTTASTRYTPDKANWASKLVQNWCAFNMYCFTLFCDCVRKLNEPVFADLWAVVFFFPPCYDRLMWLLQFGFFDDNQSKCVL